MMLEDGEEIIGFVMGYFEQYDDIQAYDLVEIVIAHGYQGKGMGTRFMQLLETKVKECGGAMIQLQAVNDERHNNFYSKLGFQNCSNLVLKSKWLVLEEGRKQTVCRLESKQSALMWGIRLFIIGIR